MFTGIVSDIGTVRTLEKRADLRICISTAYDISRIIPGASIACAGVCLTVLGTGQDDKGNWFTADASDETLSKTTLKNWREGTRVNLERALKIGDELGGHIVTGHIDGVGKIESIKAEGGSHRLVIEAPDALAPFIASKGSIALDGVSLTVNEVDGSRFGVNIIPHSWAATALCDLKAGANVNLEIDVLARYVARMTGMRLKA